jgi:thiopeptide-type bacteriocin biosynthesis protein
VTASEQNPQYQHLDAAMIRFAAQTRSAASAAWPFLEGDHAVELWCRWLAQVWAEPAVAAAVEVASPVLASHIGAVCAGQRPSAAQVRRMMLSLARYVVRMRCRATPFGLFARVAPLRFSPSVSVDDTAARTWVRADARWMAAIVAELESHTTLRHQLMVVANDLATVRGERLVVPWQPTATDPNRTATVEVSVRYSPVVQQIMGAARSAIQISDLLGKLATEFPHAGPEVLDGVVAELVRRGVLITNLRPPATCTDGLAYVLAQVDAVGAGELVEVVPLLGQLHEIHTLLRKESTTCVGARGPVGRQASAQIRALSTVVEQPLMVDCTLPGTTTLPRQVAAEAEYAAQALLRLTPHPEGHAGWRTWHQRFLTRFGAGAFVCLTQVVDPVAGLGFPSHYDEPDAPGQPPALSRRTQELLVLAQQAAWDGATEVVLDEQTLDQVAGGDVAELRPAPHLALCAEIHSLSPEALTDGEFTLAVVGTGRTAVALTGRFLDLLPEPDQLRMREVFGHLPVGVDEAVVAQLSFPPRYSRTENVARAAQVLPDVISLVEYGEDRPGRIRLDDLLVTADGRRLYLVSRSQRRVVEPLVANATARHTWPALARFLFEVNRSHTAAVSPFAWGAAGCLPFLPRVRYRRSVLAPARWLLRPGILPGPTAPQAEWIAAVDTTRERLRLPAMIAVATADRRLVLDLDEPMDLALLRVHLEATSKTGEPATLTEAPSPAAYGWCGGRAHEIVVPLATTAPSIPTPAALSTGVPLPQVGREHGVLPGHRVLFAKLYAHPEAMDAILTGQLPVLLAEWERPPLWWFVRYRDPAPHLRLRLHMEGEHDYGHAVGRVGRWVAELRRQGLSGDLVLDTYHPETTRYGAGAALLAAEKLFAADSASVVAQLLAQTADRDLHRSAVTAAGLVHLVSSVTGGTPAAVDWLIEHGVATAPAGHVRVDRALLRQAIDLTDLDGDGAALGDPPCGQRIRDAWRDRHHAATAYAATLATGPADEVGYLRQDAVLASLLHLHHIRAAGIDVAAERLCLRLARAVALSWRARHTTAGGSL